MDITLTEEPSNCIEAVDELQEILYFDRGFDESDYETYRGLKEEDDYGWG